MSNQDAIDNAKAWFTSIVEMVDAWRAQIDAKNPAGMHAAASVIAQSALSVKVRSDWHTPGEELAEYSILLTIAAAAALRLIGDLNEYGEPETARLEWQGGVLPWTEVDVWMLGTVFAKGATTSTKGFDLARIYLLDFARCFYFGKG